MKNQNQDKIIISIQLPIEVFKELEERKVEDCSSISYLIRKYIIKGLREDKE